MGVQAKDPNTVFLIELVGGFFGLLGLGYFYIGRTNDGVVRLIGWSLFTLIAWAVIAFTSTLLFGCLCIPIQIVIQLGVPLWSAYSVKNVIEQEYLA